MGERSALRVSELVFHCCPRLIIDQASQRRDVGVIMANPPRRPQQQDGGISAIPPGSQQIPVRTQLKQWPGR